MSGVFSVFYSHPIYCICSRSTFYSSTLSVSIIDFFFGAEAAGLSSRLRLFLGVGFSSCRGSQELDSGVITWFEHRSLITAAHTWIGHFRIPHCLYSCKVISVTLTVIRSCERAPDLDTRRPLPQDRLNLSRDSAQV